MTDIFIDISSKGGVGKTTTAVQFLAPYLYQKINKSTSKEVKKIKLFEVDAKNNSSDSLKNSTIFEQVLVKNGTKALEEKLNIELANLVRDYPIIIDVGVAYAKEVLETLGNILTDEKVHFIVPTKQDESDVNNAVETIRDIKKIRSDANIILSCSDALCGFDELDELKEEFGMVFGKYINLETNLFEQSIFERLNIDEKFISLKKSPLYIESKKTFKITIYEAGLIGKSLSNLKEPNELLTELSEIKEELKVAQKSKNEEKINELNLKSLIIRKKITFYKKCATYLSKYIEPMFRQFEMSL